ncbi:MAG: trypsin-like peptidase domain-containing protein [Planctomycetota bacterium]|nr:trypsin-like peptidase domain-containing protein [Planctomycetota bacterium]
MFPAILFVACLQQAPDIAAVQASESRRIEVMERCAGAVCSVMDMKAPGGGSGVIIDPSGLLLTNYHVVGAPDSKKESENPGGGRLPIPGFDGGKPDPVLPEAPEPSAEELEAWRAEHPEASDEEKAAFVARWQDEWREEHLPKGKHQYRLKKVGLPDGELYRAVVLGIDPGSDLAILRLLPNRPGQQWPHCELGDSDKLLVGETVFAMGNPFLLATDFTPTVTFGIVSGTHRYQQGGGNRMLVYPDCIQVDAPVNPGNSGGPLFNEQGQIVGINGRISIGDRGRVNVGVGFAIASNQIKNFLGDLIAGRHAEHGTLDMSCWYMDAPEEEAPRRGVFVQQMFKDSVVADAGVALGDEITMFNGERVRSANQLATLVGVLPAGAWVTVGYKPRLEGSGYGEERTVTVQLTALDTGSSADAAIDSARLASRENRRIATQAYLDRMSRGDRVAHVDVTYRGPDGETTRWRRRGDLLRMDQGGVTLVRRSADQCFGVKDGEVFDCSLEQAARLERELQSNPLLWGPGDLAELLDEALLIGGAQVFGRPVMRFGHSGAGELETWVTLDGQPAGYVLRDPLRRVKAEVHLGGESLPGSDSADDEPGSGPSDAVFGEVRLVVDGALESGWSIESLDHAQQDEALFRRPQ